MSKSDVMWISPETGEIVCTLNQCRKKFKEKCAEKIAMREVDGKIITYDNHYSKCVECGRKHVMVTDKQKTKQSKNKTQLLYL